MRAVVPFSFTRSLFFSFLAHVHTETTLLCCSLFDTSCFFLLALQRAPQQAASLSLPHWHSRAHTRQGTQQTAFTLLARSLLRRCVHFRHTTIFPGIRRNFRATNRAFSAAPEAPLAPEASHTIATVRAVPYREPLRSSSTTEPSPVCNTTL